MVEETEENSIRDLRAIPQNSFQDAFQNCKKRRERRIKSGGEYFEGGGFDQVVSKAINLNKVRFLYGLPSHICILWESPLFWQFQTW